MSWFAQLSSPYLYGSAALSLLFLVWRFSGARLGGRRLAERFRVALALVDLVFFPLLLMVASGLAFVLVKALGPTQWHAQIERLALVLGYVFGGWLLARLIEAVLLARANGEISERVPKLVLGLIYGALMFVGLGLFLWQQGYSFTGVWVSTGVAAAVLGLALQRTLGDFFSGIALGIERPFNLGDWIELADGKVGQVIDVNWRATHLRGWDNATYVIPNAQMAGQSFKNLHGPQHLFAPWYFVKVSAEVDPRFASALILEAAMRCESVLKMPNPVVRLADASAVPYTYMVWVHLRNYPAMFRGREELFREIHWALQRAGIGLAPVVHEVRTRRADAGSAEPPTVLLALKRLDLAGLLTAAELEQLAASAAYCYFDTGQVILAEGTRSDAFYVVTGGLVESAITLPDKTRKVIEVFGPGSYCGITSMLTTNPSFLEIRAKSDVTLIRIDRDCVQALISARPELAERLARVVKERLDAADAAREASRQAVRRLSLRDISTRIEGLVVRRPWRGPDAGNHGA